MANINDFKIVNMKSKRMFDYIGVEDKDEISDIQKSRLGFYHLVLENVTGLREVDEIKSIIIDTDYNKTVNKLNINDLGMDAVYINDDSEKEIQLFNFKFREKFNSEKTKSENDLSTSTKFLEYLISENELDQLDIDL